MIQIFVTLVEPLLLVIVWFCDGGGGNMVRIRRLILVSVG